MISKALRMTPLLSWMPALAKDLAYSSSCRKPSPLRSRIRKNWRHTARYASLNSGSFICCLRDSAKMDGVNNPLSSDPADFIHSRHTFGDNAIHMNTDLSET